MPAHTVLSSTHRTQSTNRVHAAALQVGVLARMPHRLAMNGMLVCSVCCVMAGIQCLLHHCLFGCNLQVAVAGYVICRLPVECSCKCCLCSGKGCGSTELLLLCHTMHASGSGACRRSCCFNSYNYSYPSYHSDIPIGHDVVLTA